MEVALAVSGPVPLLTCCQSKRIRLAFTVPAYPNMPALFPKKFRNMQKAKTDEQSFLESFGR